jgi:glycosyltransferase involved in cell wall biosynthesis
MSASQTTRLPAPAQQAGSAAPIASRSPKLPAGIRICHLSPVEGRRDPRAYTRESLPILAHGIRPVIIGGEQSGGPGEIECLTVRKVKSRFLRILTASRTIWKAVRQKAEVYHVHSPENIPAALALRFVFGQKVIYDSREDFPAMMLTKEYLSPFMRQAAKKMTLVAERIAARALDGFVTADSGTLRYYARVGRSKKLVFYNFPNLEFFPDNQEAQTKRFDLVYRGGLSERAGTMVLLNAVALLKRRGAKVSLLVFGYTDSERVTRSIRQLIADLKIEDIVTMGGVIPHADMARTLSQARIAVCPLLNIPKFMNNIPVKVFECWACGLPVIATDLPPIRPFYPRNQLGLLVPPDDPETLARVIQEVLSQPKLIEDYGRQAKELVTRRYNNVSEVRKLVRFYREVLAGLTRTNGCRDGCQGEGDST